jgi:hypothetical protein
MNEQDVPQKSDAAQTCSEESLNGGYALGSGYGLCCVPRRLSLHCTWRVTAREAHVIQKGQVFLSPDRIYSCTGGGIFKFGPCQRARLSVHQTLRFVSAFLACGKDFSSQRRRKYRRLSAVLYPPCSQLGRSKEQIWFLQFVRGDA